MTTWFPSSGRQTEAPFNLNHVEAIARNHDVSVIHVRLGARGGPVDEEYGGFPVLRLPLDVRKPWLLAGVLRRIRSEAATAGLVHTMAFSSSLVYALADLRRRRPWVHTEHWNGVVNPASVGPAWTALAWLRWVLRRPDWLTGVTTQLAGVLAHFGSPATTSVVPCVVENPLPIVEREAGQTLRLVAVGGLIARKRPILAVQALAWLVARSVDATLTWVGDGPLRQDVLAEAERLGVSERLTITGFLAPAEVFAQFQGADLFFLPTEQENFFTSAAEALSAGRAVVASNVGGFSDYANAENSVLVDGDDAAAFGDAILTAARRFTDVSAHEIADPIRARFSAQRVAEQFEQVYQAVLRERQAR